MAKVEPGWIDVQHRSHGTEAAYTFGCRCKACRDGAADARAKRRAIKRAVSTPGVTSITAAKGKRGRVEKPAAPKAEDGTLEQVILTATESLPDDLWTNVQKTLAVRLAREIDNPTSSMSQAPLVAQLRDVLVGLEKKGSADAARSGGLAGILASR